MKGKKAVILTMCGLLGAACLATGLCMNVAMQDANAQDVVPMVEMLSGASARKTVGEPGIKFTAQIKNYTSAYEYGMLILPESYWTEYGWDNDTDYIAQLQEKGVTYANRICTPYTPAGSQVAHISYSLRDLKEENYTLSLVGVAYTLKGGVYDYADVDLVSNARSMAYVAQMALQYDANLTAQERATLQEYANPGVIVEQDAYFADETMQAGGDTIVSPNNYVARFDVDAINDGNNGAGKPADTHEKNGFITKAAYAAGAVVSFKTMIPLDAKVGGWWSICWTDSLQNAIDLYAHVASPSCGIALPTTQGEWSNVSFTLPATGGPYYLYFAGAKGEWGNYGKDGEGYVYIDDFTVESGDQVLTKETFGRDITASIFNVDTGAVSSVKYENASLSFGGVEYTQSREQAAKIIIDELSGDSTMPTMMTKKPYEGGSTVSFAYYVPNEVTSTWFALCATTQPNAASLYSNWLGGTTIRAEKGAWITMEFTLPEGASYYLYFAGAKGEWKNGGYLLIDNFTVTRYGKQMDCDTFNYGIGGDVEQSIFSVRGSDCVSVVEGGLPIGTDGTEKQGDLAAKYLFNKGEKAYFVTKDAYPAGSVVSFQYYMAEDVNLQWWGIGWTTSINTADIYQASDTSTGRPLKDKTVLGRWATATATLPDSGGPYYINIGSESGHWATDAYMFIDNFTVQMNGETVVETFDYGLERSIITTRAGGSLLISEDGEGFLGFGVEIHPGELSSTASTPSFITKQAYTGVATVTFDCYVTGKTSSDWWAFNWTRDAANANVYAHNQPTDTYSGAAISVPAQDGWQTVTLDIPDGTWYFYISGLRYAWTEGYVVIDNVVLKDADGNEIVRETFDRGFEKSIFNNNRTAAIFLADGKIAEDEEADAPTEGEEQIVVSFQELLANGTILDVLASGGYAWIDAATDVQISGAGLPASMLLLEGMISYRINGSKEFVVYFGGDAYLFINETTVAFYRGTEKLGEVASGNNVTLYVAVTAGGKLNVKINKGDYVGFGTFATLPTGVRLVALGGTGVVQLTKIRLDAYRMLAKDIPMYLSGEGIDFTAYAFDSDLMISEEGFRLLADAGFTKTLALLQGRLSSGDLHQQDIPNVEHVEALMAEVNADALAALELAEKYGMKHYVMNSNLYNIERNPANYQWLDEFYEMATYTLSEAFAGHFLADEPKPGGLTSANELQELVNAYKAYKAAFPNGEAFINLLPNTSSQFALKDYGEYVDYYIANIALDNGGVKGTGYVSFDHYPLESINGQESVTEKHLANLELIAEKCRDNNLELRTYIKAAVDAAEAKKRDTKSVNDLYFQIYSALAYGSKEIIYYQFTNGGAAEGDGLISRNNLETTPVYAWAKQANNEVAAFGKAYTNFTWKSASVFGATNLSQFNELSKAVGAYGYISAVSSQASVLVGNFDDADGVYTYGAKHAYIVMNYGDPNAVTEDDITITMNGVDRVLIYENGAVRVVALRENQFTLRLETGEGAFIIPLTDAK